MDGTQRNELAGVVIIYHPEPVSLLERIQTYLPYLDRLFIIDNTEDVPALDQATLPDHITYLFNGANIGVAAALNNGAGLAYEQGFSWLLTMDQDSCFGPSQMDHYYTLFTNTLRTMQDLAVVSPIHGEAASGLSAAFDAASGAAELRDVTATITSGSLIQLNIWEKEGGFEEKLFIDEVDHEYCYRVKSDGYRILQATHVQLTHALGNLKTAGYGGVIASRARIVHSPRRVYFMVRNYLYLRSRFATRFPEEFQQRNADIRIMLKNNILFSGKFWGALIAVYKGYRDFKRGRFPH